MSKPETTTSPEDDEEYVERMRIILPAFKGMSLEQKEKALRALQFGYEVDRGKAAN